MNNKEDVIIEDETYDSKNDDDNNNGNNNSSELFKKVINNSKDKFIPEYSFTDMNEAIKHILCYHTDAFYNLHNYMCPFDNTE